MKITDLQAYKDLEKIFWKKGYLRGVKDEMPIYYWEDTDKFQIVLHQDIMLVQSVIKELNLKIFRGNIAQENFSYMHCLV